MRKNITKALRALESGTTMRDGGVSCDGVTIWSYATAIATRVNDHAIVLNVTSYSRTTTTQQRAIESAWPSGMITRVDGLDRGVDASQLIASALRHQIALVQQIETTIVSVAA